MSAIEAQNYEAVPLDEKYAWVYGQPGMRAVEAAATSVRTMGQRLGQITDSAGRSMRGLGVSWAGPASEAAQSSSRQIVDRVAHTQSLADNGADRILDYGHSFEEMKQRIAFEDPSTLSWVELAMEPSKFGWDMWTGGEDHVSILTRNLEHDAAANDALRWHEANARAADDRFVTAGTDPPAAPVGTEALRADSAGPRGGGGVGTSTSGPPTVSAASAAPAVAAPAAPPPVAAPPATGSAAPGPAAVPPPGAPGSPGLAGSGAGGGARPGGAGAGRGAPGARGPGALGAAGATGPAGTGGASGVADPLQERIRRGEQFGRDLAAGGPAARTGPGAGALGGEPPGGWYGSGGRPGTGGGAGRPGGWGAAGPEGRSPLSGTGSRPGGWRSGLGAPGGTGGLGEPTSRLPGETGPRAWSRTPGEGPLARPGGGEPAATGRGAGYAPMMGGGAGGMRSDGDAHRNRYLLPSSEPFDVDLPHAPPVLAPAEDG